MTKLIECLTKKELMGLDWHFAIEDQTGHELEAFEDAHGNDKYQSWIQYQVTAFSGDLEVKFCATAQGGSATLQEAYEFEIGFSEPELYAEVEGFVMVDSDGDLLGLDEAEIAEIFCGKSWINLIEKDLPTLEIEDIDNESDMEQYIIERDKGRPLRFKGEQIAFATSKKPTNDGGRWTELRLYKTAGGKYIAEQVGVTLFQGERTRYKAEVCETHDDIIEFFGAGWVAKDLYELAGIDYAEDIE